MLGKLQALVDDILLLISVIGDYAIGLEKLSDNEKFFDDAETAVIIISDVAAFITDYVAYTSTDKTQIV